jgi:hypothetical protein
LRDAQGNLHTLQFIYNGGLLRFLFCHRSLQNQPVGVESKPATSRCFIHIRRLDAGKGFFNFFSSAG